jgi:hypothetical protein
VNPIFMTGDGMKHYFYFSKRLSLACAVVVAAAALASCSNDTTSPSGGTPAAVAVSVAPATASQVATAIPGPSVLVTGAGGAPVAGVIVKFTASGGGAVQYPIATTDAQGIASGGLWQVGPKVGTNTVTATVEGLAPVTFTLASSAGPAAAIGPFSGSGQTGAPGSTLANPLVVRITDAGGNPKSGAVVTFAVTSGAGTLSSTTATTNASGLATSGSWTLGLGQCGQTVRATAGTLISDFTASSRGTVSVDGTADGTLSAGDCVFGGAFADEYDLTTPSGAVNISMTAGFDALAQVVTSDGTALVASDDNSGGGTNAAFRLVTAAGSKAVRATSASAGATGSYSVSVASTSADVTNCSPVFIEIGASTDQTLSPSDCTTNYAGVAGDQFLVYIPAGITVRISETAIPLDALIAFLSPTGSLIVERDNGGVGASGTEVINFTAPTSGFYKVVASSYCLVYNDPYQAGCDYGPYTLSVIKP